MVDLYKSHTKDWSVGSEVRVGFCRLIVEGIEVTEAGHDLCYLRNAAGDKHYTFTPHLGLRTNSGTRLAHLGKPVRVDQ